MSVARNLRLISWFNFWADFRPYAPIAILYFSQVSGSYALGMSIYSVSQLAQSLFEVPTGVLSDRVGRKRTVVYGAVAAVCSLTFYAIGDAYLPLLIGGLFEGLARSFYSGNNDALLYDTLAEMEQRESFQEYLGRTSSMYQFALAISAVIGSLIAAFSFQLTMWVSVIPMVLSLIVSLQLVEPKAHTRTSSNVYSHLATAFHNFRKNARLRTLSIASVLSYAIGESSWLFRSTFVASLWPVWALGVAQMIGNATAAVSFYYAGRIIRRFGEYRLLVGGMSLSEAINLFGLLVPTVLSPALMAANSVFFGVNNVAKSSLIQHEFSDEQRATMGSFTSLAGSLTFAVFSFLLGALADRIGVIPALVVAVLASVIPMVMYARVLRPHDTLSK
ncbi:MAG: MFS transporter [Chloroflexi bacterium]|nr:MFS transporter [Chloroflexota bacterium]MCC6892284.1 MFS transporter [Anaerolineae bacterium]